MIRMTSQAVLSGVSGGDGLREVLARLDTQEQALILGHAVPMPVVVQTRRYDTDFYSAMGARDADELVPSLRRTSTDHAPPNGVSRDSTEARSLCIPIRLLHTADVHIGMENYGRVDPATGINARVMDFLRRLSDMADYAIEEGVDVFVFAGDAYKTRDPNPTYQREFSRRIKKIADAGIPVILLVGNHDLPTVSKRASSVSIFDTLNVPNVYVGDREELREITCRRGQPLQVATVPYPLRSAFISREDSQGKKPGRDGQPAPGDHGRQHPGPGRAGAPQAGDPRRPGRPLQRQRGQPRLRAEHHDRTRRRRAPLGAGWIPPGATWRWDTSTNTRV